MNTVDSLGLGFDGKVLILSNTDRFKTHET